MTLIFSITHQTRNNVPRQGIVLEGNSRAKRGVGLASVTANTTDRYYRVTGYPNSDIYIALLAILAKEENPKNMTLSSKGAEKRGSQCRHL